MVALAAVAVAPPAPAQAATVHVEGSPGGFSDGFYDAGTGEANRLTVTFEPSKRGFTVSDPGATVVAGDHCESVDAHTARCLGPNPTFPPPPPGYEFRHVGSMTVTLGDGNDRFTSSDHVTFAVRADGGPGDDILRGLGSVDSFDGGGGRDRLLGGESHDTLIDGDRSGASDGDHLDGGPGEDDTVSYQQRSSGVSVDLRRETGGEAGERDSLAGFERVIGGAGSDRISGTAASESIIGNAGGDAITALRGGDQIVAGEGEDVVNGGAGSDTIDGRSGRDETTCGHGRDTVLGTVQSELVEPRCEYVSIGSWLVLPAHPLRVSRRAAWLGGRCPVDEADGFVPCRGAFKLHQARGRGRLLAQARFELDRPRPVRLRLTPLGRRLIRRPRGALADVSYRASTDPPYRFPGKADWRIRLRRTR
jgi:hypothetical protein